MSRYFNEIMEGLNDSLEYAKGSKKLSTHCDVVNIQRILAELKGGKNVEIKETKDEYIVLAVTKKIIERIPKDKVK